MKSPKLLFNFSPTKTKTKQNTLTTAILTNEKTEGIY